MNLTPAYTYPSQLIPLLRQRGYAVVSATGVCELAQCRIEDLNALVASWNDLPPDNYLKDGGRYRRRRHSCFTVRGSAVEQVPHRAHWQPVEYNALHGGMERWFEPMEPAITSSPVWGQLMRALGDVGSSFKGHARDAAPWYVEAHQFRIDTTDGIGRPTPEGAHRDGVDLVAVFMIGREGIKGGETRVFEADGPNGQRFTMTEPWSLLLLDDARVVHESTPIQPTEAGGHRDTLVLTCRAGGFQGVQAEGAARN
ncbi:MAG: 2OG-Fe dioxygenase family protein [Bdellovibrionales bacterium]|nr:2OG-Fe dioxygenase family protein [Ramlibacter sp.]